MRRFSFIVTILLLTLVSCAESGIKEYRNNYQAVPERLTATFEGVESTRIELQELYSVWSAGDEVSVFYRSYENTRWAFQGETGDRSGELKLVSGEVGEQTMNKIYMLYPYSESNSLGEDGMLYTSLPTEQSYKANSYGVGGNILVAESEDYLFSLKNVCGWIRIQLTGNGEVVQSITLSSNKGEALAGDVAVNSSDAGYTLTSSGGSSITLDCGEGVTLSESVTEFYIGILPQGLEGGITVDIVTDQDSVSKSTYEAVVVERNHILPMTAFRLSGEEAVHSELRYTATAKVEPYKASAFNVAIVSNEWDEATGEGVITFDGELTTIGDMAFDGCESLTSVTIPDSVTTIGNSAFYYCDSLTSVTIPDSVTTIGNQAFRDCHSLTSVTIPDSVTTIGNSAFLGCRSLTSVTIPDSVTTIGGGVFVSCHSLAEFNGKFAADGGRCLIKDNTIIAYAEASGATYTIPDSVTAIGDYAFCNCYSLTSVTIPDSVTTIGDYAFNGCSSLTSVTIPDSVTTIGYEAFRYCYSLTSVYCEATTPPTLGDGYVFDDNAEGRKICVPTESVEAYKAADNWSEYAADIVGYDFEAGEEEEVPTNQLWYTATALVEPYDASAFNVSIVSNEWDETTGEGVITFDVELTTIGRQAFYDCDSLTSVTIPDSVTTIGDYAFGWCESLTSVTIPDSVTTIGHGAFTSCKSLTEFKGKFAADGGRCLIKDNAIIAYAEASGTTYTIPDSVTTIGDGAFSNCDSLTSVTIPDSVTTIGNWVFVGCSNLAEFKGKFAADGGRCLIKDNTLIAYANASGTTYTIPDSVTTIGEGAFRSCGSLTSVTIPDSVTWIGYMAFEACSSLTSVTIGDSVTTIGEDAFAFCGSLTSVTIPDSVTTIGGYAFNYCTSLTSVTIPDSVTTIGEGAFYRCSSLTSVYCKATTTPTLGSNVFKKYIYGTYVNIGCTIYVPAESVEAYKAATNWSEYAADIVGYNFE